MIGDAVFARITDLKYTETIGKTCLPNLCFLSLSGRVRRCGLPVIVLAYYPLQIYTVHKISR